MKSKILLMLLLTFSLQSVGNSTYDAAAEKVVYICTGPKAKVFHRTERCKGLNKCSGEIKKVPLKDARDMGRRPCKMCCRR